jgi:hypothetical protein
MNGGPWLRRITPADHRIMPWKNGLGVTREIAIDPPGATMTDASFRWRLSIATVAQSGPFSQFPGIDRTIMVIEGKGMELTVARQAPQRLDRCFQPFSFSGDAATECKLIDGPIRDFNLMVNRAAMTAVTEARTLESASEIQIENHICIVHLLAGHSVIGAGDAMHDCAAGDTLIADLTRTTGALALKPRAKTTIALMRLRAAS